MKKATSVFISGVVLFPLPTHHDAIGHEQHQPPQDVDSKERDGDALEVLPPTATEQTAVTCRGTHSSAPSFSTSTCFYYFYQSRVLSAEQHIIRLRDKGIRRRRRNGMNKTRPFGPAVLVWFISKALLSVIVRK